MKYRLLVTQYYPGNAVSSVVIEFDTAEQAEDIQERIHAARDSGEEPLIITIPLWRGEDE